jgi:RND family efflux transporter MFP subunit
VAVESEQQQVAAETQPHEESAAHAHDEAEQTHNDDHSSETEEGHDEEGHNDSEGEAGHDEEGVLKLSSEQQATIGLKVTRVQPEMLAVTYSAPGEVVSNRYRSSLLTPQANARVIQRYAMLGDHVKQGQKLVTLFSDELADRMTDLSIDAKEWELVRQMGSALAGKKRYSEARSNFQQSLSKAMAFGLSQEVIEQRINNPKQYPLGQFDLLAPHNGVIQQDDFLIGQQINSGEPLFTLVDETSVWVEAQLPANQQTGIAPGSLIDLSIGETPFQGTLLQLAHNLSERTRTRMVRIEVDNSDHQLHPGQFARVAMPTAEASPKTVLPEAAFTRTPDGDWGVFVEVEPGEYRMQEVDVVQSLSGRRIVSNLQTGTAVVTAGTFFLASEQAKAGFDIHNH